MTLENAILKNLEKLPDSVKQTVFDYTEFLITRYVEKEVKTENLPQKRGGLGIWKDQIWIADNFDEPLEDLKWELTQKINHKRE